MTPRERDEIEALLQEVENQEMIRAPKNFKAQVLMKVSEEKKRQKKRRQMAFQFKVCVGMAAALLMLFTLNLDNAARQMTQFSQIEKSESKTADRMLEEQERVKAQILSAQQMADEDAQKRASKVKELMEGEKENTFNWSLLDFLDGGKDDEKEKK